MSLAFSHPDLHLRLAARILCLLLGCASGQSPFPVALHDNGTIVDDAYFLGPPDDVWMGLTGATVTYDFFANGYEIYDGPGADFSVYEQDQGWLEFANVDILVSLDGITYVSVKATEQALVRVPGDAGVWTIDGYGRSYDVGATGLPAVRFVKVVDTGPVIVPVVSHCDGFDLDAVAAVNHRPITVNGTGPAVLRVDEVLIERPVVEPGENLMHVRVRLRNIGLADATNLTTALTFTGMADRTSEYLVDPFLANPAVLSPGDIVDLHLDVSTSPWATQEAITIDAAAFATDSFTASPIQDLEADVTAEWDVVPTAVWPVALSFPEHATSTLANPGYAWRGAPDDFYMGVAADTITYDLRADGTRLRNRPGVDLNVYETDNGGEEFARMDVEASVDGVTWISLKASETALVRIPGDEVHNDDNFGRSYDLSVAGLNWAHYIRIVGNYGAYANCTTGFDLDAIGLHNPRVLSHSGAAELRVQSVKAHPAVVMGCDRMHLVEVTVENVGLADVQSLDSTLLFTGSQDRGSEYTVSPFAANATTLLVGEVAVLAFSVDVDPYATVEVVTVDARVDAYDPWAALAVSSIGAANPDTWVVAIPECNASVCGDCDSDGMVTILDALRAAHISVGLVPSPEVCSAELDSCNVAGPSFPAPGDSISSIDALTIAQAAVGRTVLACCQ